MKRSLFAFIVSLFAVISLAAQDITFRCEAPKVVGLHEEFTVRFVVNSSKATNFLAPTFREVNLLGGPFQSRSSSVSIINGKRTDNSSITFTYRLQSLTTGKITIPPARIKVEGKQYATRSVTISVEDNPSMQSRSQNTQSQSRYGRGGGQQAASSQQSVKVIDDKAVFVRAIPSKTKAVVGEEIVIAYKIYTLVPISEYQVDKFPSSQGFWVEELDNQPTPTLEREVHDGKVYQVATLRKVLVYPQKTGTLDIQPMGLEVVAHLQTGTTQRRRVSTGDAFFDAFFNDPFFSHSSPVFERVEKKLRTNALKIEVAPLPPTDKDFTGAVGQFEITSSIDTTYSATNEAITLNFTISGEGNLSLIDALPLTIPSEFEVYEPNISDKLIKSGAGQSGSRSFQYIIIPRVEGSYTIEPFEFTYFDPQSGEYKTLKTESYTLNIKKGKNDSGFAEQMSEREKYRNKSISDVFGAKTSSSLALYKPFCSPVFYVLIAVLILALIVMIKLTGRQIQRNADVVASKLRKANKVAMKRLKKAGIYLANNQQEEFETEIGQALWSYLSDKFKIPTSDLSMETIRKALSESSLEETVLQQTLQTLSDCEFVRFSQDKSSSSAQLLYDQTLKTITDIETQMTKIKKLSKGTKVGVIAFVLCMASLTLSAQSTAQADAAYKAGDFAKALELYQKTAEKTPNADLYHSIANTYFRMSDYASAILYYERALRLAPNDERLTENHKVCRSRLMGEVYVMPDFFLVGWIKSMAKLMSPLAWTVAFFVLFVVACVLFFVYYFTSERKVMMFYLWLAAFILSLGAFGLGFERQEMINNKDYAIVFSADVPLRQTMEGQQESKTKLFKGQKVKIEQRSGEELKVKTEDGKEGWVKAKEIKII